jgi:hypothetical protein
MNKEIKDFPFTVERINGTSHIEINISFEDKVLNKIESTEGLEELRNFKNFINDTKTLIEELFLKVNEELGSPILVPTFLSDNGQNDCETNLISVIELSKAGNIVNNKLLKLIYTV